MASDDLQHLCRGDSTIQFERNIAVVSLAEGRAHRVEVRDTGDAYECMGIVAPASVIANLSNAPLRAWLKNRATQLVGFRIDHRGRLVGEAWIPQPGLTPEEFCLYIRRVAVECDRFEYILTGKDRG
jgi:hypothetical protein